MEDNMGRQGMEALIDFWNRHYLDEYIQAGGSKIKFVTGKKGCGKTYMLKSLMESACERGYKTVYFSAKDIYLNDFKDIYVKILESMDIKDCLSACADNIIRNMGDNPEDIPGKMTYMDYLSERQMADPLMRRTIYMALKEMFLDNPMLDNNFALACSMITGGILGMPPLEAQNEELLLSWMKADKSLKLSLIRGLGLFPTRITRLNARHMLRSLASIVSMGGHKGIVVCIDDLEILLGRSGMDELHYTKLRREDTYESIRQLIDDIDTMHNIFFVFGFERTLLDDDRAGIKAYQALWMRIQNEISSSRFNLFSDMLDLDRYALTSYDADDLVQLSESISGSLMDKVSRGRITKEEAEEIMERVKLSETGVPGLILQVLLEAEGGNANV